MVFYVVYRASKDYKNRSLIPRRLRAIGCTQLGKSFWEIEEEKADRAFWLLQKNQPIFLKRIREIRKPRFLKEKDIYEPGSMVIVAYRTPKEAKRERIRNFLKRAPCIRLCRSVYAFYQEHSRFDKNNELVDARRFRNFIQEIEEDVKVVPRVVIVNSESVERLLEETRERIEDEISDIVECCKDLYQKASEGKYDEQHIRNVLSKINRRFITVKKVATFYERWLKMDFSKSLMKPYGAIQKLHSIIDLE